MQIKDVKRSLCNRNSGESWGLITSTSTRLMGLSATCFTCRCLPDYIVFIMFIGKVSTAHKKIKVRLAWDSETCAYLIRELNSTNNLSLGMFIVDKLLRVEAHVTCYFVSEPKRVSLFVSNVYTCTYT